MIHMKNTKKEIEALFQRVMQSDRIDIREQAQAYLISKLMEKQDYEQATESVGYDFKKGCSTENSFRQICTLRKGELEKAAKLTEEKFLSATTEIHGALMTLMEIALKEKRMEDAEYIADIDSRRRRYLICGNIILTVHSFSFMWLRRKKSEGGKILLPMLRSLTKKWDINSSPLYRHIQTKEVDKSFGSQLQKALVQSIETDEEMKFLKDSEEFTKLYKRGRVEVDN